MSTASRGTVEGQAADTSPPTAKLDPRGRVRPPLRQAHVVGLVAAAVALVLVPISLWQTGVSLSALIDGAGNSWSLAQRMWPPEFGRWPRYVRAIGVTVLMVIAGTAMAVALSVPLTFLASRNTTTGRLAYALSRAIIVFTRSVPDIVFALVFVRAVGIGPIAGVLAMGLHSIGMLGKLYADAVEDVDRGQVEALQAAGLSRLQVIGSGIVPQVLSSWIATTLFRLDINLRMSVILGFVGAGGIGFELQRAQGQLIYDEVLAILVFIFAMITIAEQISNRIQRTLGATDPKPGWVLRLGKGVRGHELLRSTPVAESWSIPSRVRPPLTQARLQMWGYATAGVLLLAASVVVLDLDPVRIVRQLPAIGGMLAAMWPPDFTTGLPGIIDQMAETLWIAIGATGIGLLLSIPFGLLGARQVAPNRTSVRGARFGMLAVRGVPELILAVLLVAAVGLGPFAGVLALSIGAIGFSGKLMADTAQAMPLRGLPAVDAVGANWWQRTSSGAVPSLVPSYVGISLYTLDVNMRSATILGIVGAGGIGSLLQSTMRSLQYDRLAAIILMIFVIVYGFERLSGWLRVQWR